MNIVYRFTVEVVCGPSLRAHSAVTGTYPLPDRLRGQGVPVRSKGSVDGRLGGQTHPRLDKLRRNHAGIAIEGAVLQEMVLPDRLQLRFFHEV